MDMRCALAQVKSRGSPNVARRPTGGEVRLVHGVGGSALGRDGRPTNAASPGWEKYRRRLMRFGAPMRGRGQAGARIGIRASGDGWRQVSHRSCGLGTWWRGPLGGQIAHVRIADASRANCHRGRSHRGRAPIEPHAAEEDACGGWAFFSCGRDPLALSELSEKRNVNCNVHATCTRV